jgi:hypothetical protein
VKFPGFVQTALAALAAAAFAPAQAQVSDDVVKIGVIVDMSGVYSGIGGGRRACRGDGGQGLRRQGAGQARSR